MLKIGIVDDDIKTLKYIENEINAVLRNKRIEFEISTYNNGKELMSDIDGKDLVFLDLEMPGEFGMEIAKSIRSVDKDMQIIFVTSHDNYVFEAFQYDAAAYIRKREFKNEIQQTLDRICEKIKFQKREMIFNNANGTYCVQIKEIIYFESRNHCIYIHTKNGKSIAVTSTLSAIEKDIGGDDFLRTHSGFLVNSAFVYSIENSDVILTNNAVVPVSRHRLKAVKSKFQKNMRVV